MNNNSHQNPERSATSSSELPWLAFCYVANELDAETRREFEIRLEHDQTARDAVAQAFDNAWMLNQALAQETSELSRITNELPQPETKRIASSNSAKSKSIWPPALWGIGIAGLLAMILMQLPWQPAKVEVAQNTISPTSELTNASVSLAETWADSDWDIESVAEVADIEPLNPSDSKHELDDDQDDWMTATLIDMVEELGSLPLPSGS